MKTFSHKFVEFMPKVLEHDVIYVSLRFSLVTHLCACGCSEEIVTPLSPNDWQLIYNGETVSLYPSIGNWVLRCRSHYWIDQDRAVRIPFASSDLPGEDISAEEKAQDVKRQNLSVTERLWTRLKIRLSRRF